MTNCDNGIKIGNQFFYQFGISHTICTSPGFIYAWMFEIDGQYSQKNRFHCHLNHDSGGNFIYATPSLWLSYNDLLIQFGVSIPISQNLFGRQRKIDYGFNFSAAWSFY